MGAARHRSQLFQGLSALSAALSPSELGARVAVEVGQLFELRYGQMLDSPYPNELQGEF